MCVLSIKFLYNYCVYRKVFKHTFNEWRTNLVDSFTPCATLADCTCYVNSTLQCLDCDNYGFWFQSR